MWKYTILIVALVLIQFGCRGENVHPYDYPPLQETGRLALEAEKRDGVKLEDLQVGKGPVAARGRRLTADVKVRYMDDSLVYRGSILSYIDFVKISSLRDSRLLGPEQWGIYLGLNGMRVGGRRRMTIERKLVCMSLPESASPDARCTLVGSDSRNIVHVRKEKLIVDATLTESCNPVVIWQALYMFGGSMIHWYGCQEESFPQVAPGEPIWHYY